VTACQGSPACRFAVSDPPSDLGALINKLQSSITTYEKEQSLGAETFFTDRRYYSRDQSNRFNRFRGRYPRTNNHQRGVCFVCRKEGCRSWKHTPQEQEDSKAKFKSKNLRRFDPNTRDLDRRFDNAFKQYIVDFEGELDTDDEFVNALGALVADDSDDLVVD
jgi:hypothetical protein